MIRQWKEIKQQYPHCIIFFRLGDFYETFGKDAKIAAKTLGITLTSRGTGKNRIPLAGVPYHSLDGYLAKMVQAGHHVAICEQVQDPKEATGIVDRKVVRIVTPGTILESSLLDEHKNNYIGSVFREREKLGLAIAELSTGELLLKEWEEKDTSKLFNLLQGEIAGFSPSEFLITDSQFHNTKLSDIITEVISTSVTTIQDHHFIYHTALDILRETLGVLSLEPFNCEELSAAVSAAGGLIAYLKKTQMKAIRNFKTIKVLRSDNNLILDSITLRNLEILRNMRDGTKQGTLIDVFENPQTPMGGRILRNWLVHPLMDIREIRQRHESVERLVKETIHRKELCSHLRRISDMERIISRVSYGSANPRDLAALRESLQNIPQIKEILNRFPDVLFSTLSDQINLHTDLEIFLRASLMENPPQTTREGNIIATGYNSEVDSLRELVRGSERWLDRFEEREKKRTGVKTIKTGYNKVHGYYIEITKTQLRNAKIPSDWEARQTLVNAQRYISKELKEYEKKAVTAEEKLKALEYQIYKNEILTTIETESNLIQQTAVALGVLDVLCLFAETAVMNRYIRPELTEIPEITIQEGRHPVVEKLAGFDKFISNDVFQNEENYRFLIIFGANMSGKSTFIRQVGLLVLMAQTGSFIPAQKAKIGIVDRIFTRMGAYDEISRSSSKGHTGAPGASTFMVEMREVATICHNATSRSLILMDEVGRGTGTFDGLALAWSLAEYIRDNVRARTLLSTHFHQLSELGLHKGIKNYHLAVKETEDDLVFLYKLKEGATDKSFGIHCAKFAGVPIEIVKQAEKILSEIENTTVIEIPTSLKEKLSKQQIRKKSKSLSDFL